MQVQMSCEDGSAGVGQPDAQYSGLGGSVRAGMDLSEESEGEAYRAMPDVEDRGA